MDKQSTHKWVNGVIVLSVSLILLGVAPILQLRLNVVNFVGNALYVPEYPAHALRRSALDLSGWFSDKNELIERISLLSRENIELRMVNAKMTTQRILADINANFESAQVILRSPNFWWNEIRINRGSNDGLAVGDAVFREGYLVGRISSVQENSAWIELITSSSLMLPVVVEETRDIGVMHGDGEGKVWLQFIPENRGIEEEMSVSTALVGDKLPSGLRIGKISGESSVSPNGFRSVRIDIGADLSKLYAIDYKRVIGLRR